MFVCRSAVRVAKGGLAPHRPWTCKEHEKNLLYQDAVPQARGPKEMTHLLAHEVRNQQLLGGAQSIACCPSVFTLTLAYAPTQACRRIEDALAEALHRRCPGCAVPVERTDACCHMTCSRCRTEFSWVCGEKYSLCRSRHSCLNGAIYLHCMPQLVEILTARGLPATDKNGSDLFLELRCLYLLSQVRRDVGEETWNRTRASLGVVVSSCANVGEFVDSFPIMEMLTVRCATS